MDNKHPSGPSPSFDDETAPPSYIDSINSSTYYSTQIRSQLSNLTQQIFSLQAQKCLHSHAQDEKILSLLTTEIQMYLSSFANSGLRKGTLILVPAAGLADEKALPTDYDFKKDDEYDTVVRVSGKEGVRKDTEVFSSYGSSSDLMFWRDEDMARRLAAYLRPLPDPKTTELPPRKVDSTIPAEEPKTKGFWGSRKKSVVKPTTAATTDPDIRKPSATEVTEDKVVMDVKAEEVVFRTENEFGIYETERGWGVVLKIRVILAGDRS